MNPRILLIRLSSMGDVIHALPVLSALRATFPGGRIDWLIERRWQELVELHPDLSNVIPVDTFAWRRAPWSGATLREFGNARAALRSGNAATSSAPATAVNIV